MRSKRLFTGAVPAALFIGLSFGASPLYALHGGLPTDEMQMDGESDPATSLAPFLTAPNDFDDVCDEAGPCTGGGTTNSLASRFTEDAGTSGFAAGAAVQTGSDTSYFEGGDKDLDPVSDWGCVNAPNPGTKTNLIQASSALYTHLDNGHEDLVIFGSAQLEQQNGTSTYGWWLFQDGDVDCVLPPAGTGAFTGQKTIGDILLVADVQGSQNAVLSAFYWMDDPGNPGGFCLGDNTTCETPAFEGFTCDTYTAGDALCASFNIEPITAAWGTIPPNSFLEMGVNLSELIPEGVCISKFMTMGRASISRSAQIKDYILNNLNTCGTLEVKKVANEAGNFSFTAEPDPNTGNPSLSFDLATGGSKLFPVVESGDYKITETTLPADWAIADIECVSNGKPPVSGDLATGEVDVTIGIVDDMVCTYTNTKPSIDIEKSTNGIDADTAPGPTVVIGDTVIWAYEVTNTSEVALTNVVVVDDQGVTVTCPKTTLAVAEMMTCTAGGTATAGQYANLGTVTADFVAPSGTVQVTDDDPSHYIGKLGGVDIEKATNGYDADSPTGPMIAVGAAVNWTYVVKNTGDLVLNNVAVTDDKGVAVSCPKTTLAAAEEMTCDASGTATAGQYANLGNVSAQDTEQRAHGDSDPSHYFGVDARIDIEKATNGQDADTATGPLVLGGATVNWTYVVKNTGNVALIGVAVNDDILGPITCPKTTLAAGESMTCSASGVAQLGQYENTGIVVGASPVGPVNDQDMSHYFGVNPVIDVEKATNGEDADSPTGPTIKVGDPVNWTYVVTNTGSIALESVKVIDDKIGAISCPKTTLAIDEAMTCNASGTAKVGQYENTARASGTTPLGTIVDEDMSHYYGEGIPVVPAENVPTLTEWVLILLSGLLALFAIPALRRS
jgi:uncharacterized repeat protein (TIGR01451 family)